MTSWSPEKLYGFTDIENTNDLNNIKILFENLIKENKLKKTNTVFEFGAGDGRETAVLINYFNKIDALEASQVALKELHKFASENKSKVRKIYPDRFQDFEFEDKYDAIFLGGIFDFLLDIDLIKLLIKIRNNLTDDGLLIIREQTNDLLIEDKTLFYKYHYQRMKSSKLILFYMKLVGFQKIYFEKMTHRLGWVNIVFTKIK
jgi:cyclopropane fatty-acyl-phospholipid synthase-like methyltransferase